MLNLSPATRCVVGDRFQLVYRAGWGMEAPTWASIPDLYRSGARTRAQPHPPPTCGCASGAGVADSGRCVADGRGEMGA